MARTIGERRDIELRLLQNAKDQEYNRLAGVIGSSAPGSPESMDAEEGLRTIDNRYDAQAQEIGFRNRSPLQQYKDELPRTAGQINEALENVKVNGLRSLDDQITSTIGNVLKLGGAFGNIANGIISDLIRIAVQRAIIAPLAESLFPESRGSGGGIFASAARLFRKLPKFASGGSLQVGGTPGLDRNVLSINGVPRAMVGAHETLNVVNPTLSNSSRVRPATSSSVTVIAPQQFDLTGVVMTEPLLRQMEQRNQQYANQVAAAAGRGAIEAGPARLQRQSTLGT